MSENVEDPESPAVSVEAVLTNPSRLFRKLDAQLKERTLRDVYGDLGGGEPVAQDKPDDECLSLRERMVRVLVEHVDWCFYGDHNGRCDAEGCEFRAATGRGTPSGSQQLAGHQADLLLGLVEAEVERRIAGALALHNADGYRYFARNRATGLLPGPEGEAYCTHCQRAAPCPDVVVLRG